MLLEQLSQHKLDMILSDCPMDSTQQEGLFSVKLGESPISFCSHNPPAGFDFPACLEQRSLLIPGRRSMLGRKLLNWINTQGLKVNILGEFDDAALMKAFGMNNDAIFVAPAIYSSTEFQDENIVEMGVSRGFWKSIYVIFAERMIQHPSVQRICHIGFFNTV